MTAETGRAEADEMFDIADRIVREVRLSSAEEESRWHDEVSGNCHVWGDFYGPATSPHLARALAHRFLDRQGGDLQHMRDALAKYGERLCLKTPSGDRPFEAEVTLLRQRVHRSISTAGRRAHALTSDRL